MVCNESQYLSTFVTHFDFRSRDFLTAKKGDSPGTILIKIIIRFPSSNNSSDFSFALQKCFINLNCIR